jgi:hypothetical protein
VNSEDSIKISSKNPAENFLILKNKFSETKKTLLEIFPKN